MSCTISALRIAPRVVEECRRTATHPPGNHLLREWRLPWLNDPAFAHSNEADSSKSLASATTVGTRSDHD